MKSRPHDCFECAGRGRVQSEPTPESYPFVYADASGTYWMNLVACPRCGGSGKESVSESQSSMRNAAGSSSCIPAARAAEVGYIGPRQDRPRAGLARNFGGTR